MREGKTGRRGAQVTGREEDNADVISSPSRFVAPSPCLLFTPVTIRGQRRWNSSSVVDTSSFRSTTPLLRSAAYLLLFIHL